MSVQLKRSLSSSINQDHVLKQGQLGIEMPSDTNTSTSEFKLKIGDGSTKWSALPYFGDTSNISLDSLSGTLPITKGGTGSTDASTARTNLGAADGSVFYSNGNGSVAIEISNFTQFMMDCYPASGTASYLQWNPYIFVLSHSSDAMKCSESVSLRPRHRAPAIEFALEDTRDSISETLRFEILTGNRSLSPGSSGEVDIGKASSKFRTIYASTGTIQTSDRSEKNSIHYLSDSSVSTVDENGTAQPAIGLQDVIEFLQVCEPATFLYNAPETTQSSPEFRQLGLIADDVESTKLFPYIGCRMSWEDDPEHGVEAGSTLGLKPLPVAVAALTICKYLFQRLEALEST